MLAPGSKAAVYYGGADVVWHERLVCWPVCNGEYVIQTPDGDMYIESFGGPDITRWHALPAPAQRVRPLYRFREVLQPEVHMAILERGREEAQGECSARGIALPSFENIVDCRGLLVATPPRLRAVEAQPGGAGWWVACETVKGVTKKGEAIVLDGSEIVRGDVGLVRVKDSWVFVRRISDQEAYMSQEDIQDSRVRVGSEGDPRQAREACVS
eukprot:6492120-Amphidinium_carterae.3